MRGTVKQNTDITGFKVNKLPTVNENCSLSYMPTAYVARVARYKKIRETRLRNSQMRVTKALIELEKETQNA